jgi:N-acetylmuramate 1-kinase
MTDRPSPQPPEMVKHVNTTASCATTDPDPRLEALKRWLDGLAASRGLCIGTLRRASNDASFRRYFRIDCEHADGPGSFIVMDAPPPQEDTRPFVHAARVLGEAGLRVPAIIEADCGQGFLLLDDLGQTTLLDRLDSAPCDSEVDALYRSAGLELIKLQAASRPSVFPDYDRLLLEKELMLFPQWYLGRHLGYPLTSAEQSMLSSAFELLLASNLSQPRVFVHRDYHSRNLMVGPARDPVPSPALPAIGVLDFQDAVFGPITYDLVSLLRDAYVSWPEERQLDWAIRWWESARESRLPVPDDFGDLWRDLEWMGLQRHLKVLGIFARLKHRDGKDRYLADMPRVLEASLGVARRYTAFRPLARLLERSASALPDAGKVPGGPG